MACLGISYNIRALTLGRGEGTSSRLAHSTKAKAGTDCTPPDHATGDLVAVRLYRHAASSTSFDFKLDKDVMNGRPNSTCRIIIVGITRAFIGLS